MWYVLVCFGAAYFTTAHALLQKHLFQGSEPLFKSCVFHTVRAGTYWLKIDGITHVHLLSKRKNHLLFAFLLNLIYFHSLFINDLRTSNCWYRNAPFIEDLQQKRAMREQRDKLLKQKDQDHELIISSYFSTPKQSKIMSCKEVLKKFQKWRELQKRPN